MTSNLEQDLHRDALVFAQQAEQEVLGPDPVVPKARASSSALTMTWRAELRSAP